MPTTPVGRGALIALPKIELHVHFAGTIEPRLAAALAARHEVDSAGVPGSAYPSRYRGLDVFLQLYRGIDALVRTADDVREVAAALARSRSEQRIAWTEVIVPVRSYVERGIPERDAWAALADGFRAAGSPVRIGVLLEADPGPAAPSPDAVERAAAAAAAEGVEMVGLGLMGVGGPGHRAGLASKAVGWRALGLGLQVHAGETGPPANVLAAIDDLAADRIAHGITLVSDAAAMARVVREGVTLDLCPTSNVAIAGVPSLEAHPIRELWAAGARVTISTDDPPFVGTTLVDELAAVARLLELDLEGLGALQRRTLEASFAPADVRRSVGEALASPR